MRIVTMKFGGTSVADAAAIERVIALTSRAIEAGDRPLLVVSAMSGVTDALLRLVPEAAVADSRAGAPWVAPLHGLRERHLAAARDLGVHVPPLLEALDADLDALGQALSAIAQDGPTGRLQDVVAATGELMSSRLVAAALSSRGIASRWIDARAVIRTNSSYTCAIPDAKRIATAARRLIVPALEAGELPVMGGFVGSAPGGRTTTLGRGGSDYSASLVGAAVGASEIQIWTDVDGMLTADPRIVASPRLVSRLSFAEASELAYFGAKVLHPSTILPAIGRNIPVRILNSRRPDVAGTLITSETDGGERPVTALACKRGITVVDITSTRMLMAYGFLRRVFETFERHRTPVDVVCTSEVSVSVTVDDSRHIDAIATELREFADVSIERDMAILCAVGESLRARPEAMSQVIGTLARFPLRMVSHAASRRNLTVVLNDAAAIAAMRHLHDEMFALAQAS